MRDRSGRTAISFDHRLLRPLFTAAALTAFIGNLTLDLLPFYPAAALLIFLVALGLGGRSAREVMIAAACALGATGLAWLVFTQVFVVLIG